ncbi:MAG: hypothetical protein BWY84_00596 [Candidatus Aerophobetes bacterium ADurb.Bin490]|nr:MAG: hypothetical protein BWY84_00596 [Candidatus Aerophobetes bacterium ADurb.Bin490]
MRPVRAAAAIFTIEGMFLLLRIGAVKKIAVILITIRIKYSNCPMAMLKMSTFPIKSSHLHVVWKVK